MMWLISTYISEERSGSVVECLTRSRGLQFESHQRHCVVSLSKTRYPLFTTVSTGSAQEMS